VSWPIFEPGPPSICQKRYLLSKFNHLGLENSSIQYNLMTRDYNCTVYLRVWGTLALREHPQVLGTHGQSGHVKRTRFW
jgi:hypothetical protein